MFGEYAIVGGDSLKWKDYEADFKAIIAKKLNDDSLVIHQGLFGPLSEQSEIGGYFESSNPPEQRDYAFLAQIVERQFLS